MKNELPCQGAVETLHSPYIILCFALKRDQGSKAPSGHLPIAQWSKTAFFDHFRFQLKY